MRPVYKAIRFFLSSKTSEAIELLLGACENV